MTNPPTAIQLLGPENWFEAWWIQRTERVAPQMVRDDAGAPAFAALSLDEIGFVEAILSRVWAAEHDEWNTAESAFLRDMRDIHFERGLRLRETGGDVTEGRTVLELPPLSRLGDRTAWLADELWRLEHHSSSHTWLGEVVAPIVPLGLGFGRIGNFINGELWGKPTDVPWGFIVDGVGVHASQLYEAILEGLVLFIILWWYSAKPRPYLAVSGMFLLFYGIFRFFVEFYRIPDAHLDYLALGWVTMGQILSAPMILAGLLLVIMAYRNDKVAAKA